MTPKVTSVIISQGPRLGSSVDQSMLEEHQGDERMALVNDSSLARPGDPAMAHDLSGSRVLPNAIFEGSRFRGFVRRGEQGEGWTEETLLRSAMTPSRALFGGGPAHR